MAIGHEITLQNQELVCVIEPVGHDFAVEWVSPRINHRISYFIIC